MRACRQRETKISARHRNCLDNGDIGRLATARATSRLHAFNHMINKALFSYVFLKLVLSVIKVVVMRFELNFMIIEDCKAVKCFNDIEFSKHDNEDGNGHVFKITTRRRAKGKTDECSHSDEFIF